MHRIIYLSLFFVFLYACKSSKDSVTGVKQESYILFGTGGGFTGKTTSYKLSETGQIKKRSGINSPFNSHSTVNKRTCEQIFNSVDNLDLKSKPINDPGNLYYFVELVEKGEKTKFTWGGINQDPDPALRDFYNLLHGLATKQVVAKE